MIKTNGILFTGKTIHNLNKIMLTSVIAFAFTACGGGNTKPNTNASQDINGSNQGGGNNTSNGGGTNTNIPDANTTQQIPVTTLDPGVIIDTGIGIDPDILIGTVPDSVIKKHFIIKVKTDNKGSSPDVEFEIPAYDKSVYNYNVDCDNDGVDEASGEDGPYTCQYNQAGTYTIVIKDNTGDDTGFPATNFSLSGDEQKLLEVKQWGANKWKNMSMVFVSCSNMKLTATDKPDLTLVTNMSNMFSGAKSFNGNINDWNVSTVMDMKEMFSGATSFNKALNKWDVSKVKIMEAMFSGATSFDQPLGDWEPYAATDMASMFKGIALSPQNYKNLLLGWASKKDQLQSNVRFDGGNSKVPVVIERINGKDFFRLDKEADASRKVLETKFWTISDGDYIL